ncbi:hypothetical protein [Bradyrhizobium sp. WSM2793]|uniref:hypothetical protein n=1 Tax=Bradyrhizobium sp. WSM2793 TaxID=1038866 RepID=UPI00037F00D1|nr:hypothetical protein [Bradyrhizobium sp. WSM2793]
MNDAFDQFWQWREKPPGSRLAISNEIYSAVMSLPEAQRTSREAVNAAVESWSALRSSTTGLFVDSAAALRPSNRRELCRD